MTSSHSEASANLMQELYFETLDKLDLLEPLNQVPFQIQQRRKGFRPGQRLLSLLAAQAQRCPCLTDWTMAHRLDSRLQHWLGGRPAPHYSTLSRTLAAADDQTVRVLRQTVLVPLTDQAFLSPQAVGKWVFLDVDNKAIPAEGETYEGTATGRMADGGYSRGYRLHLISLDNLWPLEMEFTGANAHAVPSAMVMFKRLMHRVHGSLRKRMVVRGDSNHGCVRFIRFVDRYHVGYVLKCYNASTARRLWKAHPDQPRLRVSRPDKPDLLAIDLGPTRIDGMTRRKRPNGQQRRQSCHVMVPRVVVYHEDPAQVEPDKKPECFALLTTLPSRDFAPAELLETAYQPRAGDTENLFCQLDQAYEITHLRSRTFHGNYTFVMLSMVAATLTQLIRQDAVQADQPIPPGLQETLVAAADCGLRLEHHEETGCVIVVGLSSRYTETFRRALRCAWQHRFRFAA